MISASIRVFCQGATMPSTSCSLDKFCRPLDLYSIPDGRSSPSEIPHQKIFSYKDDSGGGAVTRQNFARDQTIEELIWSVYDSQLRVANIVSGLRDIPFLRSFLEFVRNYSIEKMIFPKIFNCIWLDSWRWFKRSLSYWSMKPCLIVKHLIYEVDPAKALYI